MAAVLHGGDVAHPVHLTTISKRYVHQTNKCSLGVEGVGSQQGGRIRIVDSYKNK